MIIVLVSVLMSSLEMVFPLLVKVLMDDVLTAGRVELLSLVLLLFLATAAIIGVLAIFRKYFAVLTGASIGNSVRIQELNHFLNLPYEDAAGLSRGNVHSMILNDVSEISRFYHTLLPSFVVNITRLGVAFAAILLIERQLLWIPIVFTPVFILLPNFFTKKQQQSSHLAKAAKGTASNTLHEGLRAFTILKDYLTRKWYIERFKKNLEDQKIAEAKQKWWVELVSQLGQVLFWIPTIAIYYFGGKLVITGELSVGGLFATVNYSSHIYYPILGLINLKSQLNAVFGAMHRLREMRDLQAEEHKGSLAFRNGDIEIDGVCFSINDTPIIEGLTERIHQGKSYAIVGESGCGKSTLLRLLARIQKPSDGSIRISGVNIDEFDINDYRAHVFYWPQEVMLFSATVFENLTLGTKVDGDELFSLLKGMRVEEIVKGLPNGLNHFLVNAGGTLSGGQQQRIGLLVGVLRKPDILLLDEPTSALDAQTASGLIRNLLRIRKGKTTIIVSHDSAVHEAVDYTIDLSRFTKQLDKRKVE